MSQRFVFGIGELLFDLLPDGKHAGGAPVNFVYHMNLCGFHAIAVSAVGRDENGKELLDAVRAKGLSIEGISQNDLPTGTAGVQIVNGRNVFAIAEPAAWDRISLGEELLARAECAAAVCFGTLAQRGAWNQHEIRTFLNRIPENALKILDVNFRQRYYSEAVVRRSLELCNTLKVSEEEYPVLAGLLGLPEDPMTALPRLAEMYQLRNVLFTRGGEGASMLSGAEWIHHPCVPCPAVADTVGCGDGFTSYWAAAILRGKSDEEALAIAGKAASVIAGKPGAMPEMPEELLRLCGPSTSFC